MFAMLASAERNGTTMTDPGLVCLEEGFNVLSNADQKTGSEMQLPPA